MKTLIGRKIYGKRSMWTYRDLTNPAQAGAIRISEAEAMAKLEELRLSNRPEGHIERTNEEIWVFN